MPGSRISLSARTVFAASVFGVPLAAGLVEAVRSASSAAVGASYPTPGGTLAGHAGSGGFMWMMLRAALESLGVEPAAALRLLSLLSWMGLLAVLVVHAVRAPIGPWTAASATGHPAGARSAGLLMLPVAAWGVALHRDAQMQAAAGSDVSLLGLLLSGGLLLLVNHPRKVELVAAVYALTVLLRPEGLLFSGTALVYVLWRHGRRPAGRFAAVWGALVLPWVTWLCFEDWRGLLRAALGDPPGSASWSQAWAPTFVYFQIYAVLPLCGSSALAGWIAATAGRRARDPRLDVVLVAQVQVVLALVAVARAGGDFVFGRVCIPVTPLLYLMAEEAVRVTGRWFAVIGLAVVVLAMTLGAWRSG